MIRGMTRRRGSKMASDQRIELTDEPTIARRNNDDGQYHLCLTSMELTLNRSNICRVGQIPLDTYLDIIQNRELDGRENVIVNALLV